LWAQPKKEGSTLLRVADVAKITARDAEDAEGAQRVGVRPELKSLAKKTRS
jgi:hypothetical protein